MGHVAVVTDSTASLPATVAASHGITVVPLQLVIGSTTYDDGVDPAATSAHVAQALREFLPVSTSRPSPQLLADTYADLAARGAEEIVSVHLSSEMSATYESALLAARRSQVRVCTVDTRQVGAATGYAVMTAARAVAAGADAEQAARVARRRADSTTSLFYVATLEYLRRGGRVGAAAALVGSALAVKPILAIEDGRVVTRDKVRTAGRAIARLEELAARAAGMRRVEVTVSHLDNQAHADGLAERLTQRLGDRLSGDVRIDEVGAVLGAHVGPGLLGVVVAPLGEHEAGQPRAR
jgi:DegV family protein with EDD domain